MPSKPLVSTRCLAARLLLAAALWLSVGMALAADRIEPAPREVQDVGVTEHLSAQLPLDLPFVDSSGKRVALRQFFDGKRPVIVTMNYSNCPMLCSLQLNGLFNGLQGMEWDLGGKFQMITVIIDPKESPQRAALTKKKYLVAYGRQGVSEGWHLLTGRDEDIKRLAGTLGFRYTYDPDTKQYAHAAVTFICTPQGKVARYLYGIEYDPQTLKLSLLEAAEGKIGTTLDRVVLFCFHYDATKGRYGPAAVKLMKAGGAVTLVVLAGMLAFFWRQGQRRAPAADSQATESQATESQASP